MIEQKQEYKRFYSTKELAAQAGVSIQWIIRLLNRGDIHGDKVGNSWIIPSREALRYLETRGLKA